MSTRVGLASADLAGPGPELVRSSRPIATLPPPTWSPPCGGHDPSALPVLMPSAQRPDNHRPSAQRSPRPRRTSPGRGWTVDFNPERTGVPRRSSTGCMLSSRLILACSTTACRARTRPRRGAPVVEVSVLSTTTALARNVLPVVLKAVAESAATSRKSSRRSGTGRHDFPFTVLNLGVIRRTADSRSVQAGA